MSNGKLASICCILFGNFQQYCMQIDEILEMRINIALISRINVANIINFLILFIKETVRNVLEYIN